MKEKKEILIVEDEQDIGLLVKEFLEENRFNITLVNEGRIAVEVMNEKDFDLMIIDMLLPGEHGMDIIKMTGRNFLTPVIIISGVYDESEILDNLKNSNVKYFIKKPFDLTDLLNKINSSLNADTV